MAETGIMKQIQLALSAHPSVKAFRQNSGKAYGVSDVQRVWSTRGSIRQIRPIQMGPAEGCYDLTGIVSPEGWRLEVEAKAWGELSPMQVKWGEMIRSHGGVAFVARSAQDAISELEAELRRRRVYHADSGKGSALCGQYKTDTEKFHFLASAGMGNSHMVNCVHCLSIIEEHGGVW